MIQSDLRLSNFQITLKISPSCEIGWSLSFFLANRDSFHKSLTIKSKLYCFDKNANSEILPTNVENGMWRTLPWSSSVAKKLSRLIQVAMEVASLTLTTISGERGNLGGWSLISITFNSRSINRRSL